MISNNNEPSYIYTLGRIEARFPSKGTVIFAYSDRNTNVTEKYFVRVEVTEEFPFLVTKLSSYYDS